MLLYISFMIRSDFFRSDQCFTRLSSVLLCMTLTFPTFDSDVCSFQLNFDLLFQARYQAASVL